MDATGSSSESENDFFGRDESDDDLFEETPKQQQKRQEAQRFVRQYAERSWGLAARQRLVAGADKDQVQETQLELDNRHGLVVHFREKQGQQAKVWDCALVLAKFLTHSTHFQEGYFRDKRVIELGCGIGVPGLAAAVLGAQEVVLTDMAVALPWIQANIEANRANIQGQVLAEALMWGEQESGTQHEPFDVILCSDLVYGEPSIAQKLVWTIGHLSHANTRIVSSHEARFAGDRGASFFAFLQQQGFRVQEIEQQTLDPVYQASNMHVHIITR